MNPKGSGELRKAQAKILCVVGLGREAKRFILARFSCLSFRKDERRIPFLRQNKQLCQKLVT